MRSSIGRKLLVLVLIAGLLLAGCTATPTPTPTPATTKPSPTPQVTPTPTATAKPSQSAAPVIEMKYSCNTPASDRGYRVVFMRIADEIAKRTNGRVHITGYPSEALAKAKDQYDLVRTGGADMARITLGHTPGLFPLSEVSTLPFGYPTATIGSYASWNLFKKGAFDKEFGEVYLIGISNSSPYEILFAKKKPMTIADLKGVLVRTPGGGVTAALDAAGIVPVSLPAADAYMALQRGTLEATLMNYSSSVAYKLQEVCKYIPETGISAALSAFIMNKNSYNKLPKDIQDIFDKIRDEVVKWDAESFDEEVGVCRDKLKAGGMEIYDFPELAKWKALAKPIWDDWANKIEKKGLPGKAVMADYLAELAKLGVKPF